MCFGGDDGNDNLRPAPYSTEDAYKQVEFSAGDQPSRPKDSTEDPMLVGKPSTITQPLPYSTSSAGEGGLQAGFL